MRYVTKSAYTDGTVYERYWTADDADHAVEQFRDGPDNDDEKLISVEPLGYPSADTAALDRLLDEWIEHEDDWNGADAVDFIGEILRSTNRLADPEEG